MIFWEYIEDEGKKKPHIGLLSDNKNQCEFCLRCSFDITIYFAMKN